MNPTHGQWVALSPEWSATKARTGNFFTITAGGAMTIQAEDKCVQPAHTTRQETVVIKPEQRTMKYFRCPRCGALTSENYKNEFNKVSCQGVINFQGRLVMCQFNFFVNEYNTYTSGGKRNVE